MRKFLRRATLAVVTVFAGVSTLYAQTGGTIDLRWHALSGGGTSLSSGGNVLLGGSLGQFGAGRSSGGAVALVGGFWNPDSGSPLAVDIADFTAQAEGAAIRLAWETVSEIEHAGFNLYRTGDDGQGNPAPAEWARINASLIASPTPGSSAGHVYEWLDAAVAAGQVYWYRLEAVDVHGGTQAVGVIRAPAAPTKTPRKTWLPLAVR